MNTNASDLNPSRPVKVTVTPAPGTVVLPCDDPLGAAIQVPVVRITIAELDALNRADRAKSALPTASTPSASTPSNSTMDASTLAINPQHFTIDDLPDDSPLLKQIIRELLGMLGKKDHTIDSLKHRIDLLARRLYGVKSEKFNPDQLLLWPEMHPDAPTDAELAAADAVASTPAESPTEPETKKKSRKGRGHGRKGLSKNLRREQHLYELNEQERQCPCCKVVCVKFGEDVSEQLDYIPASLFVHVHTRCKYACPNCHEYVVSADKSAAPIEKGVPGAGLLAHVIVSKYADHLPLHRLERIFARQGANLSRSTMCDWMKASADLLEPLYDVMLSEVLQSKVIHTDDTKVPHQTPESPGKVKSARMWGYFGDHAHPLNVFDFTLDWSRDGPRDLLKEFRGFIQADGLSGYDKMGARVTIDGHDVIDRAVLRVGCWAHARRHFFDAKDSDPLRSAEAIVRIRRLYAVESEATKIIEEQKLTGDAADAVRLRLRRERSVKELTSLCQWLTDEQAKVLPKSPMGEAIRYALNQWEALSRYANHGFLAIDNNVAERGLRPIALGRNNWLFVGSPMGGRTAAVLFTMTSTCHRLKIDPWAYLRDVLTRLAQGPLTTAELKELLPTVWTPSPRTPSYSEPVNATPTSIETPAAPSTAL